MVPVVVRASSAVRRAKKEVDPETGKEPAPKPRSPSSAGNGASGQRKETPEDAAKRKFELAERKWSEGFSNAVRDAVFDSPGRLVAFETLRRTKLFGAVQVHTYRPHPSEIKKAEAAATASRATEFFGVLAKPTLDGLLKLEKDAERVDFDFGVWEVQTLTGPAVTAMAVALGIDASDRPMLESFLTPGKAKPPEKEPAQGKKGKAPANDDDDASDPDGEDDDA
jgi:hypothetical protein